MNLDDEELRSRSIRVRTVVIGGIALLIGYAVGSCQSPFVNMVKSVTGQGDVDPTVIEKYAVLKSPDGTWACVVTRQRFDIEFYTFTFWWLDPHSHTLMFPIETPPVIVRENIEEGPPTRDIRINWEGDEVVARFYWGDGTLSRELRGDYQKGWRWNWATNSATTVPSTSPAAAPHQ